MKAGTESKTKFKMLKRRLCRPLFEVKGILEAIWNLTAQDAPCGDIGRFTDEEIAASIEYAGDESELINALVETGWLDRCENHRLVIHDWAEHCPKYIKANLKSHDKRFAKASRPLKEQPAIASCSEQPAIASCSEQPAHGEVPPSLVKSSQAKPSQTKEPKGSFPDRKNPAEDSSGFAFPTKSGDYDLPQDRFDEYVTAFPTMDVATELRKCALWMADNAPNRSLRGAKTTVTSWLSRAYDKGRYAKIEKPPDIPDPYAMFGITKEDYMEVMGDG